MGGAELGNPKHLNYFEMIKILVRGGNENGCPFDLTFTNVLGKSIHSRYKAFLIFFKTENFLTRNADGGQTEQFQATVDFFEAHFDSALCKSFRSQIYGTTEGVFSGSWEDGKENPLLSQPQRKDWWTVVFAQHGFQLQRLQKIVNAPGMITAKQFGIFGIHEKKIRPMQKVIENFGGDREFQFGFLGELTVAKSVIDNSLLYHFLMENGITTISEGDYVLNKIASGEKLSPLKNKKIVSQNWVNDIHANAKCYSQHGNKTSVLKNALVSVNAHRLVKLSKLPCSHLFLEGLLTNTDVLKIVDDNPVLAVPTVGGGGHSECYTH